MNNLLDDTATMAELQMWVDMFSKRDHLPDEEHGMLNQARVMATALTLYRDREHQYGPAWKASGWRGNLHDMRRKITRAINALLRNRDAGPTLTMKEMDDVLDAINYAAFVIRAGLAGNEWGER